MLRTRLRRSTGTTGLTMTVTHGLGVVPDFWAIQPLNLRGQGRTYVLPGTIATNIMHIRNAIQSTVSVDVFVIGYQGRLY